VSHPLFYISRTPGHGIWHGVGGVRLNSIYFHGVDKGGYVLDQVYPLGVGLSGAKVLHRGQYHWGSSLD
jgi:hypothetical protein